MAIKEDYRREEPRREKKVKRKSKRLRKVLVLLILILVMLIGFIVYRTNKNGGGMQGFLSTLVGHTEETLENLDPIQILLMGVSTDNGGKLTDTIIIGTYDPKTQKSSLLSIPRDTFVGKNIKSGGGMDKINALYQKSPETTLKKVNEITGLDIKYYMVIDNQALIKLVDVIGGVDFYVPKDMHYTDKSQDLYIDLKEGQQILDGAKAEQLLRYRHDNDGSSYTSEYGDNDIGRMKTQRNFMIETARQTVKAKNIFKVKDIVDLLYEYVETNLSISTIKDYVPYAVNVDIEAIKSEVLPGAPIGPPDAPLWFYQVNKKSAAELIETLYNSEENGGENDGEGTVANNGTTNSSGDTNSSSSNSNSNGNSSSSSSSSSNVSKTEAAKIKIEILNGSGSEKTLSKVKKELTEKGYKVAKTNRTTNTSKTTIINKTEVNEKIENNIKEILGCGNISTSSVSSSNVDITIIIGKDYK